MVSFMTLYNNLLMVFFLLFTDIDECALNTDDCGEKGYCVNTRGTYGCQCNPGYEGNGKTCGGKCVGRGEVWVGCVGVGEV